jgi:fibro-slime domain-containing protein
MISRLALACALLPFAAAFAACAPGVSESTGSDGQSNGGGRIDGAGGSAIDPIAVTGGSGGAGTPTAADCKTELPVVIRDFTDAHPDFEKEIGDDRGFVLPDLGADKKPVYGPFAQTATTHGQAAFDQWYRDVAGTNLAIPSVLSLSPVGGGVYGSANPEFFPIDGQGLGDEGNSHNYHFTLELHTKFAYRGGEVFKFVGDDDVFVFINGKLALDLGGVHGAEEAAVDLDASSADLGISVGGTYTLDFFFAERHLTESSFRIETTIGCFQAVDVPK